MKQRTARACVLASVLGAFGASSAQTARPLQIYFIDVEGGAATLIVTPAGESVLMDAGWSDVGGRDAKRIQKAMSDASVAGIDHLIVSHYHMDHYGGVPDLAMLVPIHDFYDHGPMAVMAEDAQFEARYGAYQKAAKQKTIHLTPGAEIPLRTQPGAPAMSLRILSSGGRTLRGKGAANAACGARTPNDDTSENGRSVGSLLTWGDFQFLNLADLTWNISQRLVCPENQIGAVDLYQVTHHGGNASNPPLLVDSIRPTVAVLINGPRKGGHPDTVSSLRQLPSMLGLYQLHRNLEVDRSLNTDAELIANLDEAPDGAHVVGVSVDISKGVFAVTNERTTERRTYPIR